MGAGPSAERTQGPPGQEYSEAEASLFNAAMKPRNKGLKLIANELQLGAQPDQYRHHMVVDLHPLTVPTCTYRDFSWALKKEEASTHVIVYIDGVQYNLFYLFVLVSLTRWSLSSP